MNMRAPILLCTLTLMFAVSGCNSDTAHNEWDDLSTTDWSVSTPIDGDWVVMGSSSAAGAGARPYAQSWAGRFTADVQGDGKQLHNIAKGGATTAEALPAGHPLAFPEGRGRPVDATMNVDAALQLTPGLTIISFPSNDAMIGVSTADTLANLHAIALTLLESGSGVLVLDAQPRHDRNQHGQHIELSQALSEHFGPCFVPLYDALADGERLHPAYDYGDAVHLNNDGHAVVYDAVRKVIEAGECVVWAG